MHYEIKKLSLFFFVTVLLFLCTACRSNETIDNISNESIETLSPVSDIEDTETYEQEESSAETSESGSVSETTENISTDEIEEIEPPYYGTPEDEIIYPYFTEAGLSDFYGIDLAYMRYRWNDTVPIEAFLIDSDGAVTDIEGNAELSGDNDVKKALLQFNQLKEEEFGSTVYVGDHIVELGKNGKLYKYDDNFLLVWKPSEENRNSLFLNNTEYNSDEYYLATVFYDSDSDEYSLDWSYDTSFILNGTQYIHTIDDPSAGYYMYPDGSPEKYNGYAEDEAAGAMLDEAVENLNSLEYLGAFKHISLSNSCEYEYKAYRCKDGIVTLNRLYGHQIYDIDKIDVYNEVIWWHEM